MDDFTYTVIPIDGSFLDVLDSGTDSIRYDGLSWDEAVELCRLSFMQGYEVVIWRITENGEARASETAQTDKLSTVGNSV